jgi:uncharacterized membrane protein YgcG
LLRTIDANNRLRINIIFKLVAIFCKILEMAADRTLLVTITYWRQDCESQTIVWFGRWGGSFGSGSGGDGTSGSGFFSIAVSVVAGDGDAECFKGN